MSARRALPFSFFLKCALGLGLSSLIAQNALSWGDTGHQAVGYIAQQHLTPEARGMVFEIVGYESLSVSATFPDHVRSDLRFKSFLPTTISPFLKVKAPCRKLKIARQKMLM